MAYRSDSRTAKKNDTHRALVQAACDLFLEHGTEASSLDAICSAAGCTRGAFYVHFASREELIVAALELAMSKFLADIFVDNARTGDTAGFVDIFLDAITSGRAEVGGATLRFRHVLDACARYPTVRARYLLVLDAAAAALRARISPHHPKDAEARAQLLLLVTLGLLANVDLARSIDVQALRPIILSLV